MTTPEVRTLDLAIETRAKRWVPFKGKPRVKRIVLTEGDRYEIEQKKVKIPSLDGFHLLPQGQISRSIIVLPKGPVLRTEFRGPSKISIDRPLERGQISIVRPSLFKETTIRG